MDFELRCSQDDPSHSFRRSDNQLTGNRGDHLHPFHPSSPSRSHTLSFDQRARVNEVRTTPVASDQVCTH